MFQSLPGNLGVPARTDLRNLDSHNLSFNPFQGIWEFRLNVLPDIGNMVGKFQSLPGNLGVPASGS